MTEDEMVGWNHLLYGHEFAQAPGVCEEQRALAQGGLESMGSQKVRCE